MGVQTDPRTTRPRPTSRPVSSVVSDEEEEEEDDLLETSAHVSPVYTHTRPHSQSGSSSHPSEYTHLQHLRYPSELHEGELHPSDSASRLYRRERLQNVRPSSGRREAPPQRAPAPPRSSRTRPRPPPVESPTESGDSTEDFIEGPDYDPGMPRPQSYYGPNGYTHSSSSGSYSYPQVPTSNQLMHYAPQPQPPPHHPYPPHQHPQHSPMASPPPVGYPPSHPSYHAGSAAPPAPHLTSPYGPPAVHQYGPPQGYFPPGYPSHYPPYQPAPHPYPGQGVPPLPAWMDAWRVAPYGRGRSPSSSSSSDSDRPPKPLKPSGPPVISQEEIIKRMQDMLVATNSERDAREKERQVAIQTAEDRALAIRQAEQERAMEADRIRAEAMRAAKEQAKAAAEAQAARAAEDARIREEATRAAQRAIEDAQKAAAEQAAREARIREDAARAALEKAAAEAKARAAQEAKEAKIAADAAAAAKSEAEKKAADDAAAAQEKAKKEKEEADKKVKELEDAAAKAKTEAETAQAAADAAKPPDKKPPVKFKDAIGRNFNFPFERCNKWRDMENLIVQAFQHLDDLGDHVVNRRYDLIGPDKEIIMPEYWDLIVQPGMQITMMLWPLPEPPPPGPPLPDPLLPPPPGVGPHIIDLDDLMNGGKRKDKKGKKPTVSGFSQWMLGGAPRRKPRK